MPSRKTLPDVLVLAAGGVLGEAWMSGYLAGMEDATGLDFRDVETFVGTSAGSIVAANLAAGRRPRRPRGREAGGDPGFVEDAPTRSTAGDALLTAARFVATPLAPPALALGARGGAVARRIALAALPEGRRSLDHLHREIERSKVRFDGRLRVCCVDRGSGRRVVFGAPGSPPAEVADAAALPVAADLGPALTDLAAVTPHLGRAFDVLTYVVNELGHNPEGAEEGYLFWLAWFAHNANSILSIDDAQGVAWRGALLLSCSSYGGLQDAAPLLAPIVASPLCPEDASQPARTRSRRP